MNVDAERTASLSTAYDEGFDEGMNGKRTPCTDAIQSAMKFWHQHNETFYAYWQGMLAGVEAKGA